MNKIKWIPLVCILLTGIIVCGLLEEKGRSNPLDPKYEADTDPNPITDPTIPTNITVGSATQDSLTIAWDSVTNVVGYQVYRSDTETGYYIHVGNDIIFTTYIDTYLTPGTTYWYKVSAYTINSYGEGEGGDLSDAVSGTTLP